MLEMLQRSVKKEAASSQPIHQ